MEKKENEKKKGGPSVFLVGAKKKPLKKTLKKQAEKGPP